MKIILLFLFVSIFLLSYVSALDCQYKINETYNQEEEWFYFNGDFEGVNLKMDELVRFENNGLSFIVYNNLTIPIKVQLNYTLRSQWFGIDSPTSIELDVEPRDSKSYQEERISSGWGNYYWIEKFTPSVINPEITSEYKNVEKQRDICRTCPNGKQCLDDGSLCNTNDECGSSICNIDGFCGEEEIVSCEPYVKLNCKNQTCLIPSTKEVGEAYMCEWECKSDRFENGKCLKSSIDLKKDKEEKIKQIVIFGVIIFIIVLSSYLYIEKRKRDKVKKEREEEEKKRDKAKEEYGEFVKRKEDLAKEIYELEKRFKSEKIKKESTLRELDEKLREQKDNFQKEINYWQEKKKSAKTEARDFYNNKIEELETKRGFIIDKIKDIEKENRKYFGLLDRRNQLSEEIKTNTKKEIEAVLERYGRIYGKSKICYNEKSKYIEFISNGEPLHRYIYRKKFNLGNGYEVHHIDRDGLNNELWNLIALKEEDHEKVNHGKIDFQDCESGIDELKRIGLKDLDFPEHIKLEIKKRKEQKRL